MKKYLPFCVAWLCSVPLLAQVDLTRGLVAHYPFDGDAQDISGNGNHGTVQGASLTTDRAGNANSAYEFDGRNDYIEYVDAARHFDVSLPASISVWVYLDDHQRNMIFASNWEANTYSGIWLNNPRTDANLAISYGDGGWTGRGSRRSKEGVTELNLQQWYHVAAVVRGPTDMSLYIDGVEDCGFYSGGGGSLSHRSDRRAQSGRSDPFSQNNALEYFHGKIDDLRFYDRALNEAEILALAGNEPPSTAGLVTGDTSICEGESVVLYGGEANTYQWSPSTGLSCTTCPTPTATPEVTTTYQVTLNGGTGCARQRALTVAVEDCQPRPCDTIALQAAIDLDLTSVVATVNDRSTGAVDSVVVLWGDGNQTRLLPGASATHAYRAEGTFQVCLNAYHWLPDGQSCFDQTCERVEIREDCDALDLNPAFDLSVEGLRVQVEDRSTGPIDSLRWVWSSDSATAALLAGSRRSYLLPVEGNHEVCLETFGSFPSGNVCLQRLCRPVEATANCGLRIPNVFTPNGDGANDRFLPWSVDLDIQQVSWQVYDRWGRLVHDSHSLAEGGWDGTWRGQPMPEGTYFTAVRYLCGQQEVRQRGHLTLLR